MLASLARAATACTGVWRTPGAAEHSDAAAGAPEGLPRQDAPRWLQPGAGRCPASGRSRVPRVASMRRSESAQQHRDSSLFPCTLRSAACARICACARATPHRRTAPAQLTLRANRSEGPRLWTMTTVHDGEQDPASHHAVRSWVTAVLCVWRLLLCGPPLRFRGACATPLSDCKCTIGCRTRTSVPWTIRRMGPRRRRVERGERWRQLKDPGRRKRMTS